MTAAEPATTDGSGPGFDTAVGMVGATLTAVGRAAYSSAGWAVRPLARQVNRGLDATVPAVVDALVSRVDITELVARYVDLDALAETIDVDAVAYRLDLIGLANYIIDGVDLPAVIRQSSASFSTEAVRGVRMQAVEADQAVARLVDKLLIRRHDRHIAPTSNGDGPGP